MTLTAPEHIERRSYGVYEDIPWGVSHSCVPRWTALVGTNLEDNSFQENLKEESNRYHDIVQGNFIHSYVNMTYKFVFELYRVKHHCPTSRFVDKIDDDAIVNVYRRVDFLVELETDKGMLHRFIPVY